MSSGHYMDCCHRAYYNCDCEPTKAELTNDEKAAIFNKNKVGNFKASTALEIKDEHTLLRHFIGLYGTWCYKYHSALDEPIKDEYTERNFQLSKENMEGAMKAIMDLIESEYMRKPRNG